MPNTNVRVERWKSVFVVVAIALVACGAPSPRPTLNQSASAELKLSVKRDGIAVVADGCLHVNSLSNFADRDVARDESLAIAAIVAARADKALARHGFVPRTLAVPLICGIKIGRHQKSMRLRASRNGEVIDRFEQRVAAPGLPPERKGDYTELFDLAYELSFGGLERRDREVARLRSTQAMSPDASRRLMKELGGRYLLFLSAEDDAGTTAYNVFGALAAFGAGYGGGVGGALGGATGGNGVGSYKGPSRMPGADSIALPDERIYESVKPLLIDLQSNRLLWAGAFWGYECDDQEARCAYFKSDAGSLWRLLVPLQ